ncbi:MAG: DUF2207 domain-containing protein [Clostridia bacterium]|nr:DUF2207 domain-containing protein [Clostridia bacterium]
MKRILMRASALILLAASLLVCFTFPALADDGGFTITNYIVDAVLRSDNSIEVNETITVDFTESRHGIYREIPTDFELDTSALGANDVFRYRTRIHDIWVNQPYSISTEDNTCTIQIGSASETVYGKTIYRIEYTIDLPYDRLDSCDFLFHSVLGNQWNTRIDRFEFTMAFETPLPESALERFRVYSGRLGTMDNDLDVAYTLTSSSVTGHAENIAPHRAITLFCVMPQGYFNQTDGGAARIASVTSFGAMGISILGLLGVLRSLFRKREEIDTSVTPYPPEGVNCAEVGMIMNLRTENADMLSLLIKWINEKILSIYEEEPDSKIIRFKSLRSLPSDAPTYERLMYEAVMNGRMDQRLNGLSAEFAQKLEKAKKALSQSFTGDRALIRGRPIAYLTVILSVLSYALVLMSSCALGWAENAILALFGGGALLILGWYSIARQLTPPEKRHKLPLILIAIVVAAFAYINMVVTAGADSYLPKWALQSTAILCFAACLFAGYWLRDTHLRAEKRAQLKGLYDFISTADDNALQAVLRERPNYFLEVQPFAVAMKLETPFEEYFLRNRSFAADLEDDAYYDASYHDRYAYHFWAARNVEKRVSAQIQRAEQALQREREASSSSSSSGGGGGFSGGGSGGGGGGSW